MAAALVVAATASLPTLAQEPDEMPARVGRIADFSGQLFIAPEDRPTDWAPIDLNYPVATGDSLWISGEGRAEIDYGGGQFRMAGDTNVHISRLDEREFSLFIAQGRIIVRIRALDTGEEARVDAPNSQILLTRPGLYRIDVSPDQQETTVVVREGEAIAGVTNGTQQILPGQTATLFGDNDVQADVRNGTGIDGFDAWSATRDRRYAGNRSTSYVSPEMVGYADLDQYGAWQTYPDYGPVWFPTSVAAGWAPYRYGHWVSRSSWGWTWVDDAPWGYAPFHYGRWAYIGGRWGWCPGTYVRRPVWAPALVAWYGGSGWGVSASHGAPVYGWVPLGWREPYVPSWRNCGSRCWNDYNRPYAVNVAERPNQPPTYYVNNRVPGAITAVPGSAFAAGKPVAPNLIRVPGNLQANAPIIAGAPQLKPQPVTANIVRPGNGVPAPAAAIAPRTKPMPVTAPNAVGPRPAPGAAYNAAETPQRPARPTPAPTAVPPSPGGGYGARPAFNPADGARVATPAPRPAPMAVPPSPSGQSPVRPAPTAVPPSSNGQNAARPAPMAVPPQPQAPVSSAPPARPQPQQNAAPPPNRADVAGRPLPPSMQPRVAPPPQVQPAPQMQQPAQMYARPVPQQQAAPAGPPVRVAPPAPPPQANPGNGQGPRAEKPPPGKPGGPQPNAN